MLRKLLFCFAMLVVAGPAAADDALRCFREAGDVKIAACTRAINSGAGQPSINYYNRGNAYREKGNTDRAVADLNEAIRLDPKNVDAYASRGIAYRAKGDTDRAIADLTQAIRLGPNYADAYATAGMFIPSVKQRALVSNDFSALENAPIISAWSPLLCSPLT